jgi:chaperonin cofactor prefoldin
MSMCCKPEEAKERMEMLQIAMSKLDKAAKEGQTDLDALRGVIQEQMKRP